MKNVIISILLLAGINLSAQNNVKDILDKSVAKIKSYAALEVDFELTMENTEENINENYKGKATVKGTMYKLELMDVINFFDGKTIYNYMPEVKEVTIKLPSEEDEELLNPATIFDIHNNNFKQKLISQEKDIAYIELYPNDLDKNYSKIGIWIDTKNNLIQKVKSFGKDANNLIINIHSLRQPNIIPDDSFFKFDTAKHTDIEVIDLR